MLNIIYNTRSVMALLVLFMVALLSGACKKSGTLQEGPDVAEVTIYFNFPDPDLRLGLQFNEKMLGDTMLPTQRHTAVTSIREDKQHLVVTNTLTKEVIADTSLIVTRPYSKIFVVGLDNTPKGNTLVVSGEETSVEPGYLNLAFFSNDTNIPPGVDLYLYQTYYDEYEGMMKVNMNPVAIYSNLQPGVITNYNSVYTGTGGMYFYELRDKNGALAQGFTNNEVTPDYDNTGGGRVDLYLEGIKTVVYKLQTMIFNGGPYLTQTELLIYY